MALLGFIQGGSMLIKMNDFKYTSLLIDIIRVYLGVSLITKGFYFLSNMNILFENVSMASSPNDFVVAHIIVAAHIVGGICLTVGLLTRVMAAINIPILLGAITLIHMPGGLSTSPSEFEAAFLIFSLLCITLYFGSSKRSLDYLINKKDDIFEHDLLRKVVNLSNRKQKHFKPIRKVAKIHKLAKNKQTKKAS